jgi:hypothetical protein
VSYALPLHIWRRQMKLQELSAAISPEVKQVLCRRANAAYWHGEQAVKAYRRKDLVAYVRHIQIADHLWSTW